MILSALVVLSLLQVPAAAGVSHDTLSIVEPILSPSFAPGVVFAVDVAAKAPVAVATTDHRRVLVFDVATGVPRAVRSMGETEVWSVAIDSVGERVAALLDDGGLVLWDLAGEGEPRVVPGVLTVDDGFEGQASGVEFSFSPDGERILVASAQHGAVLLSRDGVKVATLDEPGDGYYPVVHWGPRGDRIVVLRRDGFVILDGHTGVLRVGPDPENRPQQFEMERPVLSVALHPTRAIAYTGHDDSRIRVLDLESGEVRLFHEHDDMFRGKPQGRKGEHGAGAIDGRWFSINAVALSPDATKLSFSVTESPVLAVIDTATGRRLGVEFLSHGNPRDGARLEWALDGSIAWCAAPWIRIAALGFAGELELDDRTRHGAPPRYSGDIGVMIADGQLRAVQGPTAKELWVRSSMGLLDAYALAAMARTK